MAIWKETDQLNVYVDESGTVNLNDPNDCYIPVGIIVPEQKRIELSNGLDEISKKFFSGNVIKSSNIGNDHVRREKILREIVKLDFQYLFLYVDKSKINPNSGYRYKSPSYKNLNAKLYHKLCQCSGYILSFVCKTDQYGNKEFQNDAKRYFEEKQNLLQKFSLSYADDKSDRILQLADFIAGTLVFCWVSAKKDCHYSYVFRELLKKHEFAYETFPRFQREIRPLPNGATHDEINTEIEKILYNRAMAFIEKHKDDDDEFVHRQIAMLDILLEDYEFDGSRGKHFLLNDIQEILYEEGFEKIPRQQFISKVIGQLRYEGIIISGSNKGYCLALSLDDIKDYLDHNATVIFPMLDRIKEARSAVKIAMQYDILQIVSSYKDFEAILDARKESEIANEIMVDDEETIVRTES